MKITEKQIEEMAKEYAESENSAYTNDYYGFISGFKKALTLYGVSISNRVEMNYLDSKYEVKWLMNDVYQVEQDGNCIYQDTETGCNEYLKGLLGY